MRVATLMGGFRDSSTEETLAYIGAMALLGAVVGVGLGAIVRRYPFPGWAVGLFTVALVFGAIWIEGNWPALFTQGNAFVNLILWTLVGFGFGTLWHRLARRRGLPGCAAIPIGSSRPPRIRVGVRFHRLRERTHTDAMHHRSTPRHRRCRALHSRGGPSGEGRHWIPVVAVSAVASADSPGTGLGLTISRDLVEAHGGTLVLQGEVGAGTPATIRLPLHAEG